MPRKQYTFEMDEVRANFVKKYRVDEGYSWRAVHQEWQLHYEPKEKWWFNPSIVESLKSIGKFDPDVPHGHGVMGMDLCYQAMNYLGESFDDGWN